MPASSRWMAPSKPVARSLVTSAWVRYSHPCRGHIEDRIGSSVRESSAIGVSPFRYGPKAPPAKTGKANRFPARRSPGDRAGKANLVAADKRPRRAGGGRATNVAPNGPQVDD